MVTGLSHGRDLRPPALGQHRDDLLPACAGVAEGDLLWAPGPDRVACANVTAFTRWLAGQRGRAFGDYQALWQWSVTDLDGFWQAVWDYCGGRASVPPTAVLARRTIPGAEWFPGARLNYAEHILRHERPGQNALLFAGETVPLQGLPWDTLAGQVRVLATQLRAMGVRPGDRGASYLPNVPQTVIALLAAASIGAVWTSCSPDFGWRGVLDRFRQLTPKVLFCADGYRYGGHEFGRRDESARIAAGLPGLEHVIYLPLLYPPDPRPPAGGALSWDEVLDHAPVPAGHPGHPHGQEDGGPGVPHPERPPAGTGRQPQRDGQPGLARRVRRVRAHAARRPGRLTAVPAGATSFR